MDDAFHCHAPGLCRLRQLAPQVVEQSLQGDLIESSRAQNVAQNVLLGCKEKGERGGQAGPGGPGRASGGLRGLRGAQRGSGGLQGGPGVHRGV